MPQPKLFSPKARWIWLKQSTRDYNTYAAFRRSFTLKSLPKTATLHITADARYEVYLNGHWLGHGPIRSFPNPWPVDPYEVAPHLRKGENTLAILATHFGISTFQYLHSTPGLIAELRAGAQTISSDPTWKALEHQGYAFPVPRISCQQPWEEQFDARIDPGAPEVWTSPDFDDRKWPCAIVVRSEHTHLEPRPIPHLTREPLSPLALRSAEIVTSPNYTFTLNPHDLLNKADRSANHYRGRLLLFTWITSPKPQPIDLHTPHHRPTVQWKLNGQPLTFNDHTQLHTDTGIAHAKLKKGTNVLVGALPEIEHPWWATINLWTESPITFSSNPGKKTGTGTVSPRQKTGTGTVSRSSLTSDLRPLTSPSPFLAFGPFPSTRPHVFDNIVVDVARPDPTATPDRYDSAWTRGDLTPADLALPIARPLPNDMFTTTDVYAQSAADRPLPNTIPQIENPTALLHDTEDWTTVHPPTPDPRSAIRDPRSLRLLLDFGPELVGYHEFEIDAPAGAILDNHNFEFIQRDGRHNLNEGMNNSFRYVCREGTQRYRTFIRRGFRYAWFTFRNFKRPIKIRHTRALFSTYPQQSTGSFACSDALLNDIWTVGVRSVRCCSEDTYTDCPTYEQTFWVGDARNEAMVDLLANGDPRLSEHCLRLAARSLNRSPLVESQVPSGWQNLLPTWSFLWMRWAQEHYQLTGDTAFANELLEYIDRNVQGVTTNLNQNGLFQLYAWNLFDWAGMDTPAAGVVTHLNCLIVQSLRQSAGLAAHLGHRAKAKSWIKLADHLTKAINTHLWSDEKQAYADCIRPDGTLSPTFSQQTATAAYLSGVPAAHDTANGQRPTANARSSRCREILHNPPPGFITTGSPFFMFFLLEALVREQNYESLIDTIRTYWGAQVNAGATTFWEMYHPDKPRLTRSHCHGWSAAPVVFLTQHLLGVQPLDPGYTTALISPHPTGHSRDATHPASSPPITWAQGTVPTPRGPIDCHWTDSDTQFTLRLTLPPNTRAQLHLPYQGTPTVTRGAMKPHLDHFHTTSPALQLVLPKAQPK